MALSSPPMYCAGVCTRDNRRDTAVLRAWFIMTVWYDTTVFDVSAFCRSRLSRPGRLAVICVFARDTGLLSRKRRRGIDHGAPADYWASPHLHRIRPLAGQ